MKKLLFKAAVICSLILWTMPSVESQAKINDTLQKSNPETGIPFPDSEINRDIVDETIPFVADVPEIMSSEGKVVTMAQNSDALQKRFNSVNIDNRISIASAPENDQRATQVSGIYGHVTENGVNASGILLQLRYYNGSSWSTYTTTYTNSSGDYLFSSAPSIGSSEYYYVRYLNSTYVSGRLYYWGTKYISNFNSGDYVNIGNFDIAEVGGLSPEDGSTVTLEKTFEWNKRTAIPTDVYELDLIDPVSGNYWYTTVGNNNSLIMNCLPEGFGTSTTYGWYIGVYSDDGGYGNTFYIEVKFKKDHSCSKIHGTVTQDGSATSDVYLELRHTDDSGRSFSTRSESVTDSNGDFEFVNIPTIAAGETYYVRYIGGNNSSISGALWFWGTSQVSSYTQNTDLNIGTFDIADVDLGLPAHNATISLPYTFTWDLRSASPGDNYYLAIEDDDEYTPSWMSSKGYNNSSMISCLYYAMESGTPYRWWIDIHHPGTNAYGISYYYHVFTISSGTACGTIFSFLPISIR